MRPDTFRSLRAMEQLLSASHAEAERLLPELLGLPGPLLCRELRTHPELRTPGMMRGLLTVAHDALDRFPSRAHELSVIVVRYAGMMAVPPALEDVVPLIQGEAWREYANALREVGRGGKAARALERARSFFAAQPAGDWHLATVDLVDARLLHDAGRDAEALRSIRRAADCFALFRDDERYLQARMFEAWMLCAAGDEEGAAALWNTTYEAARQHGGGLAGRLASRLGVFELRHGSADEAEQLLTRALRLFVDAGLPEEAIRARCNLAEALTARGRFHEAISEYHKVRAELLARGKLIDAAVAAVEILELLVAAGRARETPTVAATFVHALRDAGMSVTAMEALAYLRGRAEADALTGDDFEAARRFFQDLPQRPYARFVAPG